MSNYLGGRVDLVDLVEGDCQPLVLPCYPASVKRFLPLMLDL